MLTWEIKWCNSAALVEELSDETRFKKKAVSAVVKLQEVAHDGLFTANGHEENWAVAHRILMPVFGPLKIRALFNEMKDVNMQMCLKW